MKASLCCQLRDRINAERECYLRLSDDERFNSCQQNITEKMEERLEADGGKQKNAVSVGVGNVDCRLMQEYLKCAAEIDYYAECKNMLQVESVLLQSIVGQNCHLQVKPKVAGKPSYRLLFSFVHL